MVNIKEFKSNLFSRRYLYSYVYISSEEYDKYIIIPDSCDYILISTKGHYKILRKSKMIQAIELENESLFILRLKPYTLCLLEKEKYIFLSNLATISNDIFDMALTRQGFVLNKIFEQIKEDKQIDKVINAAKIVEEQKGEVLVQDLAKELDLSSRTLQRLFKNYMDFTPKEYISIIRLQADIRKINIIKNLKMNNISSYYFDYSHFFKVFKKYTTITPNHFYSSSFKYIKSIYDIY